MNGKVPIARQASSFRLTVVPESRATTRAVVAVPSGLGSRLSVQVAVTCPPAPAAMLPNPTGPSVAGGCHTPSAARRATSNV